MADFLIFPHLRTECSGELVVICTEEFRELRIVTCGKLKSPCRQNS
jgi:hypothetical protein